MKQAEQDVTRYVTQRVDGPLPIDQDLPSVTIKPGQDAAAALMEAATLLRTGLHGLQACADGEAGGTPEAQGAVLWCVLYTMEVGHALMESALAGMREAELSAEQASRNPAGRKSAPHAVADAPGVISDRLARIDQSESPARSA